MTPITEAQAPTPLRDAAIEALAAESIRFTNPGITDEEIYTLEHAGTLVIERRRELCARQLDALRKLLAERGFVIRSRRPTQEQNNAARDWSRNEYGRPIGCAASEGCYAAMILAAGDPLESTP